MRASESLNLLLKKSIRRVILGLVFCINALRKLLDCLLNSNSKGRLFLIAPEVTDAQLEDMKGRLAFYAPSSCCCSLTVKEDLDSRDIVSLSPILFFGKPVPYWKRIRSGTFDVDYRNNPQDGWDWCDLSYHLSPPPDLQASMRRFNNRIDALKREGRRRCYVFGTGPSLEKAIERDWSDGYRVVCNTIVRDRALWCHLNPDFIVAGDAIYHFGHTDFAREFRNDMVMRLKDTETFFIYPSRFDSIVQREFSAFAERLIPIPRGVHSRINIDLTREFVLPNVGNVLALLLLPVACVLSREICLWGFDGRAPDDKLFWSNSNKHSYPELLPELQNAHPCFFDHYVPRKDPFRYVRQVHGDLLDTLLQCAEQEGWRFEMMHHSWTPTLEKRHRAARVSEMD